MANLETIRQELHEAVDEVLARHGAENEMGILVESENEVIRPWSFRWPNKKVEPFDEAHWYRVIGPSGAVRVLLALTTREAWGRADLSRFIVFGQIGRETSESFYPFTEFVETEDGRFGAQIPNPRKPRSILRDGDPLPGHLPSASVHRVDRLYSSIKNGPSLRYVVTRDETEAMIRHGYWVAELRRRLRG